MPQVRSATAAELPAVGRILAAAFADDPVWQFLTSPRADWDRAGTAWFHADARRHRRAGGEVLVDDELGGAALWSPPGRWKGDLRQTLELALPSARLYGRNLALAVRTLNAMESRHPHEPDHWYLAMLGTDPSRQGLGIGGALIRAVTDRCDREGLGAYLESSKESNVPYYRRFGFEVHEELPLPGGGPSVWRMWRDPQDPGEQR